MSLFQRGHAGGKGRAGGVASVVPLSRERRSQLLRISSFGPRHSSAAVLLGGNPSRGCAVHFTTRSLKQIRQWVLLQLQDGDCTAIFPARIVEQQIVIALIPDLAREVKRVTFAERQFHSVHLR
jgi:hypothetical protein